MTMNTGKEEVKKTVGPPQILLTLKKSPRNCHMTAVIDPVTKDRGIKVVDNRKMIKINSRGGRDMFMTEIYNNFKKFDTDDHNRLLSKITQVSKTNKQPLPCQKKSSILNNNASKSGFCQTFREILYEHRTTDNFNIKVPLETNPVDSTSTNVVSTSNKQDRFVPNILRNTRMTENILNNNNNQIRVHSLTNAAGCRMNKNVKRKRKQILNSLDVKLESNRRAWITRNKNGFNESLLRIRNRRSAKESKTKISGIIGIKSEQADNNNCSGMRAESITGTGDAQSIENYNPHDSYSAEFEIPCRIHNSPIGEQDEVNCINDKSIKQIFAEFEVADYQKYIASEDLGFHIDEMDKLLGSDINGSITDSFIPGNNTRIVECDVNGNDIDNYGNAVKKNTDENKIESSNVRCKIEPCYCDRTEQAIPNSEKLRCDLSLDAICPGTRYDGRSYRMFKINSWSTEFKDYHLSDDFYDFHHTFNENSSSTDTAPEVKGNEHYSTQILGLVLPKIEDTRSRRSLLAVTDIIPANVFDDNANRCFSNGLDDDDFTNRSSDSSPTMQQYHLNSNDFNDNGYCTSLPGIPCVKLPSNLKIYDGFDANFELFQDDNYLGHDMLDINCAVSKEDETCERILANSNAKFDSNQLFDMHSDIFDLDIGNVDDIAMSKLLRSDNAYNSPAISDVMLQPCAISACDNEFGIDTVGHTDKNNISISNHNDCQFGSIKFVVPMEDQVGKILNGSMYFNGMEDSRFTFDNDAGTGEQGCRTIDKDFQCFNSTSGDISPSSKEPCNTKSEVWEYLDRKKSRMPASPPLMIEGGENLNKLETSKLESLLRQGPTYGEYPSNATNYSRIPNTEHCSELAGYPCIDTSDSTFLSCKNCHRHIITDYKNFKEKLYSYIPQERNITAQGTSTNLNEVYSVTERRYCRLMQLDSPCIQNRRNSQQISNSECLMKPASPGKGTVNLRKRKKDVWRQFVKRSKFLMQDISYIPCDFCEKKYRSQAALGDHIELAHRYKPSRCRYREKKYVCDKCSKEYCLPGAIEKHFKLHENYLLTCRICDKHFSEKIFLRRHVYSAHLHWNVECNYCGRKFSRINELTQHLKRCHGLSRCSFESSV